MVRKAGRLAGQPAGRQAGRQAADPTFADDQEAEHEERLCRGVEAHNLLPQEPAVAGGAREVRDKPARERRGARTASHCRLLNAPGTRCTGPELLPGTGCVSSRPAGPVPQRTDRVCSLAQAHAHPPTHPVQDAAKQEALPDAQRHVADEARCTECGLRVSRALSCAGVTGSLAAPTTPRLPCRRSCLHLPPLAFPSLPDPTLCLYPPTKEVGQHTVSLVRPFAVDDAAGRARPTGRARCVSPGATPPACAHPTP